MSGGGSDEYLGYTTMLDPSTGRIMVNGYTFMGHIQIPPLPETIILTDRGDGTLWALTHNTTTGYQPPDGLGYISITDVLPTNDYVIYAPFEGPRLSSDPSIVLLVRDGYLGYEQQVLPRFTTDIDNAPVRTRRANAHEVREIIVPTTWKASGDLLAWQDVPFT